MKEPSKSNHIGWERVYLERIHAITIRKNRLYEELLGIIDRLANKDSEYKKKRKEFDVLEKHISDLEEKVEQQIQKQMRGNE